MTANRTFAVHSLDHARLSARKFAQQHVFPHISAAFPIWRPRMFLSSAIHDKPPRGAGCHRAAFSRNRRKQMGRQALGFAAPGIGRGGGGEEAGTQRRRTSHGEMEGVSNCAQGHLQGIQAARTAVGAACRPPADAAAAATARRFGEGPGKPGRAPGHRLATTEPESSPCPAALAPRTCANETYANCHVAGCPYPVKSAHPSRKEAL